MEQEKVQMWAIVELFGHQKLAGKLTEQNIGSGNMIRIDVPETTKQPGFTRFLGNAAIYAINPVTEETAKAMAERYKSAPIDAYDFKEVVNKMDENAKAAFTKLISQAQPVDMSSTDDEDDYM